MAGTDYDYPLATCVPLEFCIPLPNPEHGKIVPAGNVTIGDCVSVQCDDGYGLDPDGEGKDRPCCLHDADLGIVRMEEAKKCYKPEDFCETCDDVDRCPHCFIGLKKFAGKRREFHFDERGKRTRETRDR